MLHPETQKTSQEIFEAFLNENKICFEKQINHYLIYGECSVNLSDLNNLPENITFWNDGHVYMPNLINIPKSTLFENKGNVYVKNVKGSYLKKGKTSQSFGDW